MHAHATARGAGCRRDRSPAAFLATRPRGIPPHMIVIRKGSFCRPRATSRRAAPGIIHWNGNCSVESATHLSRGPRAARPSDHTQVNDSCVTNHRIDKEHRPADAAAVKRTFPAIVPWSGQGARPMRGSHGPAPRPGGGGRVAFVMTGIGDPDPSRPGCGRAPHGFNASRRHQPMRFMIVRDRSERGQDDPRLEEEPRQSTKHIASV